MFLIDVKNGTANAVDVEPTLSTYYEMLDCTTIDIVERSVGGVYYDFICDDEGLFVENPKCTAFTSDREPMLVGNLLICLHDGEGNEVGLDDKDVVNITQYLQSVIRTDNNDNTEKWTCLVGVDY